VVGVVFLADTSITRWTGSTRRVFPYPETLTYGMKIN
jgi:hypothetical protein